MKKQPEAYWLIWLLCFIFSCRSSDKNPGYATPADALFVSLLSAETNVNFINAVEDSADYNILTYRNFYNGGGVATGDINNDNLPDIFLTANLGDSKLFLNKGGFKFEDITTAAGIKSRKGWRTGVTMADVNADGWLDIYICNSGDIKGEDRENELYINQHNNTFKEQAKQYGLNDTGFTTQASFIDYDLDGDLDCYILNNSLKDLEDINNRQYTPGVNKLFRNDKGYFTDQGEHAGIADMKISYGPGVSTADVNGDIYPDLYISNDLHEKDYLYINQRDGTFKDELSSRVGHISGSSRGADIVDLNNDGFMDIITTDRLPEQENRVKTLTRFGEYHAAAKELSSNFLCQYPQNTLQLNNGDGTFREIAFLSGIAATDWSWGALGFDFDNDGYRDIFISNGIYRDIEDMDFADFLADKSNAVKTVDEKGRPDFRSILSHIPSVRLPNYAYLNQHNLHFINASEGLGLGSPSFSNGASYADLDNDGDLDLVVNNVNDPCFIYRNDANKIAGNHFLKINLKGGIPNPFGVGACVNLFVNGQKLVAQNFPVRSYLSCVDSKLIFGLGKNTKTDSVEVIWPDLRRQVLYNVEADKEIIIEQKNADKIFTAPSFYSNPLFTDRTAAWLRQPVVHKENSNVDFDTEKLIPYRLSSQGPTLAQADINGDGLEDIYVGGAAGEVRKILIQTASGFIIKTQDVFEKDKNREDAGAAFFDVDNDKDADLVVASGGYQFEQGSSLLEARLYINDGKGNFSGGDLPGIATNASCVRTADYDRDGYPDVFIGGRAIAGNYGKPGRSYLLHNEKGVLRDRTPEQLKEPGMVTDIVFSDTNLDGFPDIVMTGEWMPVNIFLNRNGIFEKKTVENSAGLWNCVTAADIDKDGDTDYILGNWGLNSRFRASVETPMELFINDFDNNGSVESLLAYYWPDGKSHLFNSRQDLMTSMPMLKNKFPLYKDFADKSVEDITGADALKKSTKLKVETLASSVLINGGNNQYALMPLPAMAQLSPVFTAIVADFDNDDNPDIFTGGNFFDSKPDIGRLDANPACLLKGDGKRHFSYVSKQKTGLAFDGQVRDGILIRSKQKKLVVLARNNASVLVLESGDD